ncbi:ASCH domain-containing protein [Zobellia galactanivorans]|uniref:ASCH domain-containing protein n=1 Tax=Zobellia galactanivorans (strain DSM 12802 / CCUG 47099 / CIP 106680 / NCIMB 13871 / Dsij) TaxID=63186 RepID=UPI001C071433|nr:ASCH domain-containing protein [Zobellia galactanivorans]MBU3027625.1 ASCH domain-containing protein [Zobellia galactanivorans]MDO6807007.1 ASCH domain-containing protein [Zobellia galactanivorans]
MKHLILITFLVLSSCKGETKAEQELAINPSVQEMWERFTTSYPEFKEEEQPESWFFHDNEEDANRLAELVVQGKKQAGSGLYSWYKEAKANLPSVGTKHIITDFDGTARAIIETKKVDTIPFNQISEAYAALDMGTTNEALQKWKKAHWDFFASTMKESEKQATEDMLVVCEYFETLWP